MYKIYKITNTINGKIYVGQTMRSLNERLHRHIEDSKKRLHTKFANAIKKYGKEAFIIEQIDTAETKEDANCKEIFWIKELKATDRYIGYNTTDGGDGGNTYLYKTNREMLSIKHKISKGLASKNNGKHRSIYVKNIITGDVKEYGAIEDFCRIIYLPHKIVCSSLHKANFYGIQTVINGKYIVSDTKEFSRYTFYKTRCGETPFKVTNLLTNEVFYGICKRECAEHFNLADKRCLERKTFLVEPMRNEDKKEVK
jgi:group I intron endonuclease